jgi:hypothetical protein
MSKYSPIALFVFKRPNHTEKCIKAIQKNIEYKETVLFVFCDGPRIDETDENKSLILKTRQIINKITGFKEIKIFENQINLGLSKSVIKGIETVFKFHHKIIVIEDDIIVSPNFLSYMNWALSKYDNNPQIATIQGFQFPIFKNKQEFFLDKTVGCWGWGTWQNQWGNFESDSEKLLIQIEENNLKSEFNLRDSYNFCELLKLNYQGNIDSWAINWYASLFLKNKLNLYPTISLTKNIGNDGSGTHKEINYKIKDFGGFNKNQEYKIQYSEEKIKKIIFYRNKIKCNLKLKNIIIKIKYKLEIIFNGRKNK